jgi:hypothetical protein
MLIVQSTDATHPLPAKETQMSDGYDEFLVEVARCMYPINLNR